MIFYLKIYLTLLKNMEVFILYLKHDHPHSTHFEELTKNIIFAKKMVTSIFFHCPIMLT